MSLYEEVNKEVDEEESWRRTVMYDVHTLSCKGYSEPRVWIENWCEVLSPLARANC